jgi:predicted dehydrogenase
VRFDLPAAIQEFRPDIVAIATTAAPHCEMALAAAAAGCHVVCEKPLAVDAVQARQMLQAVERAGVKHGYGATGGYIASYIHVRRLLADGLIGSLREIEHLQYFPTWGMVGPYFWFHQWSQGGGMLNTIFTHMLQRILFMTGGTVVAAAGATRRLRETVPVGKVAHDQREWSALTPEQAAAAEQRPCDADDNFTVMLQLRMPDGHLANALAELTCEATHPNGTSIALFGTAGVLYLREAPWPNVTIQHFDPRQGAWADIAVPQAVIDTLPKVEDPVQREWNQLYRDFCADVRGADVRGEGATTYPTFRDGWVAVEVMDIVRRGSWTALPAEPGV